MSQEPEDEIIGAYGGDAFGNRSNTVRRCRGCQGLYLEPRRLGGPVIVGLIFFRDDGRAQFDAESRLAELYQRGPRCECADRKERSISAHGYREPMPPVHHDDLAYFARRREQESTHSPEVEESENGQVRGVNEAAD